MIFPFLFLAGHFSCLQCFVYLLHLYHSHRQQNNSKITKQTRRCKMSLLLLHVFFICLNIGFFVVTGFSGQDLGGQPLPDNFDGDNSTGDLANIKNPTNSTGNNNVFDRIYEFAEAANSATMIMFNAVTGGFIFDTIDGTIIDLPENFVIGIKSLIGILLGIQIFYWWSGRSSGKLS